ncbi:hypothetical protein [Defluviitalea raffinosedens]|uniref:hypothetical protein n=1 Tax=Defluviitalea raffinosedens TaxID=1450156 RepID=UPI00195C2ACB|nr:hypothetical protein [Defluviitalea raffinosedens]MBM7685786.1 hypothetical protein [Defluviitalea raffinosedens]
MNDRQFFKDYLNGKSNVILFGDRQLLLAYIDMRNIILFLKVIGKVDILKKTC